MKSLWSKRIIQLAFTSLVIAMLAIVTGCSNTLLDLDGNLNSNNLAQLEQSLDQTNDVLEQMNEAAEREELVPLTSFDDVSAYIREHGELPNNFITKNEARDLGWVAAEGNLHDVAPGMSIGGDRFGNREGLLPKENGRTWNEADINYSGGHRNADRIVYSNDGLIYMTTDHYQSFTDITEGMN